MYNKSKANRTRFSQMENSRPFTPLNDNNELIKNIDPQQNLVEQLNNFCQSDVKTKWTKNKLRTSREKCGFSYIENKEGDWIMMPSLCPNCDYILQSVNKQLSPVEEIKPKWFFTHHQQMADNNLLPSPMFSNRNSGPDNSSMDYLIYSTDSQSKRGCCIIM